MHKFVQLALKMLRNPSLGSVGRYFKNLAPVKSSHLGFGLSLSFFFSNLEPRREGGKRGEVRLCQANAAPSL